MSSSRVFILSVALLFVFACGSSEEPEGAPPTGMPFEGLQGELELASDGACDAIADEAAQRISSACPEITIDRGNPDIRVPPERQVGAYVSSAGLGFLDVAIVGRLPGDEEMKEWKLGASEFESHLVATGGATGKVFLVTKKPPCSPLAQAFVDYMRSAEGREILAAAGFVPVTSD